MQPVCRRAAGTTLLRIEDLNVSFATPRGALKAVRNVSIELEAGRNPLDDRGQAGAVRFARGNEAKACHCGCKAR